MNSHEQPELLSAYLDGELDAAERSAVDAHLPTCTDCRSTLDALRATVSEMRALEEPAVQGSFALRSAIARARGRTRRVGAWTAAVAGAAASIVALAALFLNGSGGKIGSGPQAAPESAVVVETQGTDYDQKSAQTLLVGEVRRVAREEQDSAAPQGLGGAVTSDNYFSDGSATRSSDLGSALTNCETQTFAGEDRPYTRTRAIAATYGKTPAFLLVYRFTPSGEQPHLELWVLRRSDCNPLYFAQREE